MPYPGQKSRGFNVPTVGDPMFIQVLQALKDSGRSRQDIAAEAGIDPMTFSRYCNGRGNPNFYNFKALATVAGFKLTLEKVK